MWSRGGRRGKKGLNELERFIFRLALQCGEWDVYGMCEKMPYSLFRLWNEYHKLEPFGSRFDNWLMAVPANMFSQVHAKNPIKVKDLMYQDPEDKRKEDHTNFINFLESYEPRK